MTKTSDDLLIGGENVRRHSNNCAGKRLAQEMLEAEEEHGEGERVGRVPQRRSWAMEEKVGRGGRHFQGILSRIFVSCYH